MMLGSAPAWEKLGERWFTRFAGVAVIEAAKQIYARPTPKKARRQRVYVPVPQPIIPTHAHSATALTISSEVTS
jgi:hypothetical protein